jgi:hypothetical protein
VQHEVGPLYRLRHRGGVGDVTLDEFNFAQEVSDIFPLSRNEVVQDPNLFSLPHQFFCEVGADEARTASYEVGRHFFTSFF